VLAEADLDVERPGSLAPGVDLGTVRHSQDRFDANALVPDRLSRVLGRLADQAYRVEEHVIRDRLTHIPDNQGRGVGEGMISEAALSAPACLTQASRAFWTSSIRNRPA